MYNLLVVEDIKEIAVALKNIIESSFSTIHVLTTTTFDDACTLIQNPDITTDFFFFDIELDSDNREKNGIMLGKIIRSIEKYQETPIIFLTAYDDYAIGAINEVHCSYYLTKPYTPAQVCEVVQNLLSKNTKFLSRDHYGVSTRHDSKQLVFAHMENRDLTIIFEDSVTISCGKSLHDFIDTITYPNVIRCHKQYIVNLDYCTHYDKTNRIAVFQTPKETFHIPIGLKYKKAFEQLYNKL